MVDKFLRQLNETPFNFDKFLVICLDSKCFKFISTKKQIVKALSKVSQQQRENKKYIDYIFGQNSK